MLFEFLTTNRAELISRCSQKGAKRFNPRANPTLEVGVPLFLDQLIAQLKLEHSTTRRDSFPADGTRPQTEIRRAAGLRGAELLLSGYTVEQVVHEYGSVCQSVTELAIEEGAPISTDEFRTLNRCLDDAIADAVASYGLAGKAVMADQAKDLRVRLDIFWGEHRRLVEVAIQAFSAIKGGNVGVSGATGALLDHALHELGDLSARSVPRIRLAQGASSE